jgi:hypothetical protein
MLRYVIFFKNTYVTMRVTFAGSFWRVRHFSWVHSSFRRGTYKCNITFSILEGSNWILIAFVSSIRHVCTGGAIYDPQEHEDSADDEQPSSSQPHPPKGSSTLIKRLSVLRQRKRLFKCICCTDMNLSGSDMAKYMRKHLVMCSSLIRVWKCLGWVHLSVTPAE